MVKMQEEVTQRRCSIQGSTRILKEISGVELPLGLERLKILEHGKDESGKRVLVYRDKRIVNAFVRFVSNLRGVVYQYL